MLNQCEKMPGFFASLRMTDNGVILYE